MSRGTNVWGDKCPGGQMSGGTVVLGGQLSWGDTCPGGQMSGGQMSGGTVVQGDSCPGGHLSGGQMSHHQSMYASCFILK